jgi:sodium transport system permease protein
MLNSALIIASKEIADSLRDVRSVISSLMYALMGPLVVGLVSLANHSQTQVLLAMMSVFTLVSAFVGGMNVAMDTIAGERERRSLLPLLLNPVRRVDVAAGKWLAVAFFSVAGLAINVLGSAIVCLNAGIHIDTWPGLGVLTIVATFPLPLLAAALQLLISTACRSTKEAQTYLSMIVFLPMGIGMFLVFFPAAARDWCGVLPLLGQQIQLQRIAAGRSVGPLRPIALGLLTAGLAQLVLFAAARRLQRDEIVLGN